VNHAVRFQIVQRIAFGLIMGLFLTATVSCQSRDVRSTSQEASSSDQGYQLGPEDVLLISVWKDEHLTREVVVRPDGMISFPLVGDVPAEGRTVEELRIDLAKRLIKYIPAVNITVAVIKPLSYKVYVVGRVRSPANSWSATIPMSSKP
jgi:polysaccharide export outer membrane protein